MYVHIMTLFTRSLWPDTVRAPYRRLLLAMVLSPCVLSIVLSLIAVVLAGLSEQSGEAARAAAIDSALTLTVAIFGFTISFGVIGVVVLWSFAQRGPAAWAVAGLVAGALAGAMLTEVAITGAGSPVVIFTSVTSVALFLLVRAIAGVQDPEVEH